MFTLMFNYKKPITTVFLTVLILLALSIWYYHSTIFLPPSHIHAWTQSDCYSLAIGFIENHFNFFKPQTYNLQTRYGITAVDFPIQEYIAALLMKVTGSQDPMVFRLFTLLCCLGGITCFALFVARLSTSIWKGIFMGVFIFTLPVMTYFQAGFIPSPVALCYTLAGTYFYFLFLQRGDRGNKLLAFAFFTLAALIRLPFVIPLCAIIAVDAFGSYRRGDFNPSNVLLYILSAGIFVSYFLYNQYLQKAYGSAFLTRLLYVSNFNELKSLIVLVWQKWRYQYFTIGHYLLLLLYAGLFTVQMFVRKRFSETEQMLWLFAAISFTGGCCYFFLMSRQFINHEYYICDAFYFPVVLILSLMCSYVSFPKLRLMEAALFTVLMGVCIVQSGKVQVEKYADADWDEGEKLRKNFAGAKQELDLLGVPANAKILVIDAYSTNAPLLLAGRKGYTVLNTFYHDIDTAMGLPFDFIVIQDRSLLAEVMNYYPPFQSKVHRVGGNGKISVFKLSRQPVCETWQSLLGVPDSLVLITSDMTDSSRWKNVFAHDNSGDVELSADNLKTPSFAITLPECRGAGRMILTGNFMAKQANSHAKAVARILNGDKVIYSEEQPFYIENAGGRLTQQFLFILPSEAFSPGNILTCCVLNGSGSGLYCNQLKTFLVR